MAQDDIHELLRSVCTESRGVDRRTLEAVIVLAAELAREGREGRKVGAMFVVGDSEQTLKRSRCLILDPLAGHPDSLKRVEDPGLRETAKELAQLDGAFIVSDEGVFLSACRYIDASSAGIDLPLGLGSRHMAAASITKETRAIAVVVSESSVVRIFDGGEIVAEIIPELWLLRQHGLLLHGPYTIRTGAEMAVAISPTSRKTATCWPALTATCGCCCGKPAT